MKIKHKILVYISTTVIPLIAIAFVFIYVLFAGYREEEFQQQQNEKIRSTIRLIEQFQDQSAEISFLLDEQDINDFYDEKLLIFDQNKKQIFASLDDLDISKVSSILNQLSVENKWIETKEDEYDLIGVYVERNNKSYYALSKAYDAYGHTKLNFLRNSLVVIFLLIGFVIVVVSVYIAKFISFPIANLASKIDNYELDTTHNPPLQLESSTLEIQTLIERFNEMLAHTQEVFKFQKHTINHISHQLKTPISVLVNELEVIQSKTTDIDLQKAVSEQMMKAKSLGEIINVLLEISKIETGQPMQTKKHRIDELLFDCIQELNIIYSNFHFNIDYMPLEMDENNLLVEMNPTLLKQAFTNLLSNAVSYSTKSEAQIRIIASAEQDLKIQFINTGDPISKEEEQYLFKHFFRGENSKNKAGYGLGLILTKKIIDIHEAKINYTRQNNENVFEIIFNESLV